MFTGNVVVYVLFSVTLFASNVIWYQRYIEEVQKKHFKHKRLCYAIFAVLIAITLAWCTYGLLLSPDFGHHTRADLLVSIFLISTALFFEVGSIGMYRRALKRLKETRAASSDAK